MRIASTRKRRKREQTIESSLRNRWHKYSRTVLSLAFVANDLIAIRLHLHTDFMLIFFFRLFWDRLGRRVERNVSQLICAIKRRIYASACTLPPSKLIFMAPVLCVNSINFALNSINRNGRVEIYGADTEHVVLSCEAERELSRGWRWEDEFKTEHEYNCRHGERRLALADDQLFLRFRAFPSEHACTSFFHDIRCFFGEIALEGSQWLDAIWL